VRDCVWIGGPGEGRWAVDGRREEGGRKGEEEDLTTARVRVVG
jgi:hypothetical protein